MTKLLHKHTHLTFPALQLIKGVYPRSQYITTAQISKYYHIAAGLKVHQTISVGNNEACTPIRKASLWTIAVKALGRWILWSATQEAVSHSAWGGKVQKFRFKRKRNLWDRDNNVIDYHDINVWCTKTMCLVQVLSQAVFYCIYSALKSKTSLSAWLKK